MSTLSDQHDQSSQKVPAADAEALARAMAWNLAKWTDASVRCFGIETFHSGDLWWRNPGGSVIYDGAVICDAQTDDDTLGQGLESVEEAWGARSFDVYDCRATRDLARWGYRRRWQNPWYVRLPSSAAVQAPALLNGATIETVTTAEQLAEFEAASWEGFEAPPEFITQAARYSQHALTTLDDPGMYYLNLRVDGQVAASTIAYITDDMVGIYGISTLPQFRRRGYATALVRAVVALRPDLPISTYPDPDSLPIYGGDFVPAGEIAVWQRMV